VGGAWESAAEPVVAPVAPARSAPGPGPAGVEALLPLAASVGNAAFAGAVAPRGLPTRWIARYEAGEHAQMGGTDIVMVNGVPIPSGNIIAMGDFYRSPEAMTKAPAAELKALNDLIERDKKARMHVPGVTAPTDDEIQQATMGRPEGERYMDLNKANFSHFAPPKDPAAAAESAKNAQDNKSAWEKHHRTALDQAHKNAAPKGAPQVSDPAKPAQGTVPEDAKVTNLFAAHYLTDAFASGHMINKADVMEKAKANWAKVATHWGVPGTNDFTDQVAPMLLKDPAIAAAFKGKQIKLIQWADVDASRISQLLYGMSTDKDTKGDFFNLFARMVHDVLNREGVEVSNANKPWKAFGDAHMDSVSLEQGRLAVAASEKNLEDAAAAAGDLDYAAMFAKVWALVPKPTAAGDAFIQKIVDSVGDAGKKEAREELVRLAREEIPTMVDELTKKGYLRDKPKPEAIRKAPIEPKL
jgi:hypothetical protein